MSGGFDGIVHGLWDVFSSLPDRNIFLLQYFTGLECGHKFCMQCWGDYLTTKIIEEGMGQVLARVGRVHEMQRLFKKQNVRRTKLFHPANNGFLSVTELFLFGFLRLFLVLLIVVTFWLMTTQWCEYYGFTYSYVLWVRFSVVVATVECKLVINLRPG